MTGRVETAGFSIPYGEGSVAGREVAAIRNYIGWVGLLCHSVAGREVAAIRNAGQEMRAEMGSVAGREVAAIRNSRFLISTGELECSRSRSGRNPQPYAVLAPLMHKCSRSRSGRNPQLAFPLSRHHVAV